MTVIDRVDAAASSPPPGASGRLRSPVRPRFVRRSSEYWPLMIRGAVLQAITLGIYRFWLFTDMRRFLWSGTEVEGEPLEYTGTAVELLIGFLIAIGILVPIYAVLYVASLEAGFLRGLSAVVGLLALAGFGQFAIYRARRYRLTRTVFRGLRFHQGGSAVHYAVRAMLWWIPTVITLGLAAPWATADLERYKMRNTFYGKLGGSFAASGGRLFMRGVLIWILIVAPVVVGLVAAASMANWPDVMRAMSLGTVGRAAGALPADDRVRIWLAIGGVSLSFIFGIVLYPAYQAIAMRWWLGGLRLGGVTIATDLLTRRYYFAYLRYLGDVVLYTLVMGIVASFVIFVGAILNVQFRGPIDISGGASPWDNRLIFGSYIALYVIYALGVSTIYQVWIKMRLWRVAVESMLISGIAALDHVQAGEATSSAVGEGLADALGTGAI